MSVPPSPVCSGDFFFHMRHGFEKRKKTRQKCSIKSAKQKINQKTNRNRWIKIKQKWWNQCVWNTNYGHSHKKRENKNQSGGRNTKSATNQLPLPCVLLLCSPPADRLQVCQRPHQSGCQLRPQAGGGGANEAPQWQGHWLGGGREAQQPSGVTGVLDLWLKERCGSINPLN